MVIFILVNSNSFLITTKNTNQINKEVLVIETTSLKEILEGKEVFHPDKMIEDLDTTTQLIEDIIITQEDHLKIKDKIFKGKSI